jgi:tetratricopeptide (TPR) repeat protein
VWHEATAQLRAESKLVEAGIALEQHPNRTRLFMQWKTMDWRVMVDPFNRFDLPLVPITLILDEYGVIRLIQPLVDKLPEITTQIIEQNYPAPDSVPRTTSVIDLDTLKATAEHYQSALVWRDYAVGLTLWGGESSLNQAITIIEDVLQREDDQGDGTTQFYAGVIYRKRLDSAYRQTDDFAQAVAHWVQALEINPNNYVRRRRLQQYGPRLDKPYPFYDWVAEARDTITARGETPIPLVVEPGGAEFAAPTNAFIPADLQAHPDPDGRIWQDENGYVSVEITTVPPTIVAGDSMRVHVTLRPNESIKAHWNNEADGAVLWIDTPDGWQVDQQRMTLANPADDVSLEPRHFEFEVRVPEATEAGTHTVNTAALYYVCEDVNGICLYRRQDIHIPITVRTDGSRLRDGG